MNVLNLPDWPDLGHHLIGGQIPGTLVRRLVLSKPPLVGKWDVLQVVGRRWEMRAEE